MTVTRNLFQEFSNQFEGNIDSIRHFSSPARINIIGEHVDYLGGIVLPAAINFSIQCLIRPNGKNEFRLYSLDYNRKTEIKRPFQNDSQNPWADYIAGVIIELEKIGHAIPGFDLLIQGNIPQGSGLSSSAALEVVVCYAITNVFQIPLTKEEIAVIGQKAENHFVGTKCGIMDQFIIAVGKQDYCISLNTETLKYDYHHFDLKDCEFYLINSNVKHSLKDSEYNTRREECESALKKIKNKHPNIQNLYSFLLPEKEWDTFAFTKEEIKRVKHVVGERERTTSVINGLKSGDLDSVGKQIYDSHWSLSENFEVSCPETDHLVSSLERSNAKGARMIGGGFGGCVLVLDKIANFSTTSREIEKSYQQKFGHSVNFYKFKISDGVKEITKT
ncbi:galactokinase [Leptospira idonii]|uniref:Galactokinase n=1 Tax=Leptospira idonii TaxID=1193500 RepID=A0A4R9M118_9LEPT|nr:galactokinase [Leptospira idonii]TGN20383.1 galactokinase [Leptospira idonii]